MSESRLLCELVDIPTSVQSSDFVVSLAKGVQDPARTLGEYVVTKDLAECFDAALALVATAIADNRSKGAYLHGSFGSGKSHFMAVLHLLLQGNPDARAIGALSDVVAKHDDDLRGKDILLVPYHMVGKASMEAGILGGYVDHVREHHPDAPLPPVYADEQIFDDARREREQQGDDTFFRRLNSSTEELEGFGDLAAGWDATSFDAAIGAPADDPDRRRLAADLIAEFFRSYANLAAADGTGYVDLEEGLAAISVHAKDLGYDAVLLFLDELILWLASHVADPAFITREAPKVSKLVEHGTPRPIPIVSLIARQRDLRDFVGEGVAGNEHEALNHTLSYWEGRFQTITLSDTNLPAIVEQRLLKPRTESAAAELDQAFEAFTNRADKALDTLMTSEADRNAFRASYPFSPALIKVLVGLSAFLQRERTSLRLLQQLLVDRRDDLTVGQLVPLGDLWDVVDEGEEPLDQGMKRRFAKARRLYNAQLRPLILEDHNLTEDDVEDLPPAHAFHAEARLAKTLLLAALVPDVEAVRGMTVGRLTDLNHGSIRSPIPGQERSRVHGTVNKWASRLGQVRVDSDQQNPAVSLQLVGVNVDDIIASAITQDSPGARVRLVRTLLADAIDLPDADALIPSHRHEWRGRTRTVSVAFANVRDEIDIPDSGFLSSEDTPKVVIDFPFDDDGKSPSDDIARIHRLRERIGDQPTLCWIPRTLSATSKQELGTLVVIEYLLTGDRLDQHTNHLPAAQRVEAREILEGQRRTLRTRVLSVLLMAYGIDRSSDEARIRDDIEAEDQFKAIDRAITVKPPAARGFAEAFDTLLDGLWSAVAPGHPPFPERVTRTELARALDLVQQASAVKDRRIDVARDDRKLLQKVVAPLQLATVGEAHLVLDRHWRDHFHKMQAADPGPLTVERLRSWTDQPRAMRLDDEVLSLVISAYAVDEDRVLQLGGQALPVDIGRLDPRTELVAVDLPDEAAWAEAQQRVPSALGIAVSPVRSAANVAALARDVRAVASEHREATARQKAGLAKLAAHIDLPPDSPRRAAADAAWSLLSSIEAATDGPDVVAAIVGPEWPVQPAALGATIRQAAKVANAIDGTDLDNLDNAFALGPPHHVDARNIRSILTDNARHDQLAADLSIALDIAQRDATRLIRKHIDATTRKPPPPLEPPKTEDTGKPPTEGDRWSAGQPRTGTVAAARGWLDELGDDDTRVTVTWHEA